MKDLDGAIKEYHETIRLKPDWAEANKNLGWALYTKGDLDAAVTLHGEHCRPSTPPLQPLDFAA